jgi:putative alpha-1,2-mannosidase
VLADAFVKGLTDGIDWEAGYAAVQKDAEEEPYDWSSEGRGGLMSWKSLHYIPVQDFDYVGFGTMTRSVSRTLEYSYNDYSISQIARGLNKTADAEKYEGTSGYWRNLFKTDQTSYLFDGTNTGFVGFFQPKYLNETWGYQVGMPPWLWGTCVLIPCRTHLRAQTSTIVGGIARSRMMLPRPSSPAFGNMNCRLSRYSCADALLTAN